ncbi:IS21 family transposase [Vibrio tapetis]|nr:IS21 family transposase [Vibrio tapetis]SON49037.1 transposase [Vibrio tapetis subsp. tapetis]SON50102.1 transposase [Vibrio tapetis subsp. tapetis]SON50241.1 transposase [Vibrio tapetis subsp. tapetis]SON51434.1 transposase [Vibrio tapetis subsp. tapetis]SON51488.1 transposase [Vibrio tapetis subsp. tapetis]
MPKKRTPMTKIKEVLRLKFECGLSHRNIASCLKIGCATVSEIISRFNQSQIGWPLPDSCSDTELTNALYHPKGANKAKAMPNFANCCTELKRKGMTKLLLWEEYYEQYQERAYAYTQFCEHYMRWLKKQKRSMRQTHIAGDKLFIDYCGPTIPVVNPDTGEIRHAQVFVATLGASNYTYVEASESQKLEHWLEAHANAFEHFGGVPRLLVPDNLRSAVTKHDRYEPQLNDSYQKLSNHYQTAVMPARPYKPKDKAKAENAVLIVERWIMMRLRHNTFHTFKELNLAIRELMNDLNQREMKQLGASRQALFEQLDKPALRPLPIQRYIYTETKRAKVGPDYHIEYRKHYYSVPHQLVGQHVELEATSRLIRIYYQGNLVSQHPCSPKERGISTYPEHMPSNHRYQKWSPERLLRWGEHIGAATREMVNVQLMKKAHPEQAYRSCLGLLNLSKKYGDVRLEQACKDALLINKPYLKFVKNLLVNHREGQLSSETQTTPNIEHSNVRGPDFYH